MKILKKIIANKGLLIAIVTSVLIVSEDLALIIGDTFFGEIKGVIFNFNLYKLILSSNLLILGIAILIYIFPKLINYFEEKISKKMAIILVVFLGIILCNFILIIFIIANNEITAFKAIKLIKSTNVLLAVFIIASYILFILLKYSKYILAKFLASRQNIILAVITFMVSVFFIEVIFYVIRKVTDSPIITYTHIGVGLFRNDSCLGYALTKNLKATYDEILIDKSKHDTSYIFKTVIKTDSLGNRFTDIPGMQTRKKYAVFFGCSFTFGVGVQDTQTIPYYFAKYDTNYCVYNFGVGGYGTQQILAKLQHTSIRKLIKQDSGICFYIYTYPQLGRVIGDKLTYTSFGHDFPYYGYKHDSLHCFGTFGRNRVLISSFYTLMNKSNVVNYFNINFPLRQNADHYKLTCDIIQKAYQEYKKQFHNESFYVVVYPTSEEILKYLKYYNIKVIDLSKILNFYDKRYYISDYDRHPTALAHELFAKKLINTSKILGY